MEKTKTFLILLLIVILAIFALGDFANVLLSFINNNLEKIKIIQTNNPYLIEIIFFTIYVLATTISLPVASILGLLSGMIFGLITAVVLVSFASTIGATFAFLISRYLFRDYVETKFNEQYKKINDGFIKNSGYYLFALRMCVIFPYFVINLVSGLTTIRTSIFYIISQIGMLPGTIIIILLGSNIGNLISANVGIGMEMILLLTALGLLPLISRYLFQNWLT
ncbi:MAG: TVP38/TMEM64 family protein [Gammaproteobacteria bacterium]|nr:TVP38/TMEM64 family protein [Gammaproteobacteria bacterium]